MAEDVPTEPIRNIDARLSSIEQYLPSLTTRDDIAKAIDAAIAPLATRDELQAAIAPLATREDLHSAIAPLASREELREEGERARRHATVLFEDLRDDNRLILNHLLALSARVDSLASGV